MSMQDKEAFLRHWTTFMERLNGRIRRETRKTDAALNNILAEQRLAWALDDDELGRWLITYTRSHPDKGALVRKILLEMELTSLPSKSSLPSALTQPALSNPASLLLPLAGAAVGFGVSHFLTDASQLAQVISTVAPAVVLYGAEFELGRTVGQREEEALIQACAERLERYKQSVISILIDE